MDALIRGGAVITHSCRRGTCHACLMRVVEGEVEASSLEGLSEELVENGHFLPCQSFNDAALTIEDPDFSFSYVEGRLMSREQLEDGYWRLRFRPAAPFRWFPGQYLHIRRLADEETRAYCVVNQGQRSKLCEFVVEETESPFVQWLIHELGLGGVVLLQGPHGQNYLHDDDSERPLTLVGVGAGLASVRAIAQDVLVRGTAASITLYYVEDRPHPAHELEALQTLCDEHSNLQVLGKSSADMRKFFAKGELSERVVRLAGEPELIQTLRAEAILAGAKRSDIRATSFERAEDFWPVERDPFALFEGDPAFWKALDEGKKMRLILDDFYTEVYEDALLSPFFENVTKDRAVSKQWSFLADAFSGSRLYFGLKPFNAHHWMIISDDVFDYREEMFERYLIKHGVEEEHRRMWLAYQERFRREIIKHKARGLIVDGKERQVEGFSMEQLSVGSVCDGCHSEMHPGAWGRLHLRTGRLYCEECRAVAVEQSS